MEDWPLPAPPTPSFLSLKGGWVWQSVANSLSLHFRRLTREFVKWVWLLGNHGLLLIDGSAITSDLPRLCSGLGMGPDNCRNARNVHVHTLPYCTLYLNADNKSGVTDVTSGSEAQLHEMNAGEKGV